MDSDRKAIVVLLSGGLDSSTALAIAKEEGFDLYALSVDYGQRHKSELDASRRIATHLVVKEHSIIKMDLREFGGSALTDDISVPKGRSVREMQKGIPETYVPARNTILLSLALAWAEVLGINDISTGVNAVDYSGYPDCRPEYIAAFQEMANLATKSAVEGKKIKIHTPLINLSKAEIIKRGTSLGVDYSLTVSCYDASTLGQACGECDSCLLRAAGFMEAGVNDSTMYVPPVARL